MEWKNIWFLFPMLCGLCRMKFSAMFRLAPTGSGPDVERERKDLVLCGQFLGPSCRSPDPYGEGFRDHGYSLRSKKTHSGIRIFPASGAVLSADLPDGGRVRNLCGDGGDPMREYGAWKGMRELVLLCLFSLCFLCGGRGGDSVGTGKGHAGC